MDSSRLRSLLLLVPILGGLFWYYTRNRQIWVPSYRSEGEQPYDLGDFKTLLKASVGEANFTEWNRGLDEVPDTLEPANIFFANSNFFGDSIQRISALALADKGHHLFLCSNSDPNIDSWHTPPFLYSYYIMTDSLTVLPEGKPWQKQVVIRNKKEPVRGRLLVYTPYDTGYVKVKGRIAFKDQNRGGVRDTAVNWIRVDYGKGAIHYLSTPLLISNYELRDSLGFAFAQAVVGELPKRSVLWDNYNIYPRASGRPALSEGSELAVIRREPALRTAWLVLIALGLLFLLFGARRVGRPIPLLSSPDNRSIGFARRLGMLFLRSGKPRYLAEEMMRLFDNHNHRKYGVQRDLKKRDEAVEKLYQKTGVPKALLQRIFRKEWELRFNPSAEAKELLPLFNDLQQFYSKAR